MQTQEGLYEGCYEDLKQLDLLRVLLPHYRVEAYEQEKKEIYSEPYYKEWYCTYRDGDDWVATELCWRFFQGLDGDLYFLTFDTKEKKNYLYHIDAEGRKLAGTDEIDGYAPDSRFWCSCDGKR